ncbi:MAG: GGDEF domain-containing protein [Clostridiales bacterium]|nr:GGDEF domain-containing protein [Clostridiales bacterium]
MPNEVDMKRIAVLTSHVYEQMSGLMQKGINAAALEHGVKIIYFASFSDSYSNRSFGEYTRYDEGDNVSFDIADLNQFDGVIKISTYFSEPAKVHLRHILSKVKVPVVNIGGMDPDMRNVCCDEARSFREIVEHLISEHGCRNIYHLAGLEYKSFTYERIEAYKEALERNNIPYDPEKVYFGTLWRDCGDDALDYILEHCEKNGTKYPDAVVCANDYSALGLVVACRERGIRVPADIKVTGYDGVDDAVNGYPSITTSSQPFYQSGYRAVESILEELEGVEQPKTIRILGELMCNQSCGCKKLHAENVADIRDHYLKRLRNTTNTAQSTTNLLLKVYDADTHEECFKAIAENARSNTGFKEMLICIAPGWDQQRTVGEEYSKIDEEMRVVAGFRGEQDVEPMTFRKKDILPKELLDDPYPYYIYTLHHLQYYMGYLIVSPDIDNREQESLQSWLVDLSMILESRRVRKDLELSVSRLEFLYNRDMLTGIYNRRGIEQFFGTFHEACHAGQSGLALMVFDMDDLKTINDSYGHNEGDYSIKTIADALTSASKEDEICTRSGGDEFVVLAKDYDIEKMNAYVKRVREYIVSKVKEDKKPYQVSVSFGAHIGYPHDENTDSIQALEDYQRIADAAMYVEKRRHKGGNA